MVVLGLDGLPFSLARKLCGDGLLPNLARIALADSTGVTRAGAIRAELPELSPVNWTSFATAAGPEEHGVFGFTRIDPRTYEIALTDATCVAVPTIFDRLGAAGLTSKVVNLPNTYPARPFAGGRGMLVAGFVAPELSRAVHPPVLGHMLARAGYRLEADTARGAGDPQFLLADLRVTLASRRMALDMLWPDLAWDVFCLVLTETDRLFHFLFPAVTDSADPHHAGVLAFLAEWDALVGEVLDRYEALPGPKRLLVTADHGFGPLRTEVDLNAWLRANGYLRMAAHPVGRTAGQARELDATSMSAETTAFALDPGRIYLHTAERFARGAVGPVGSGQARELAERIRQGLTALTWEGEPVMDRVLTADELYDGPRRPHAPDLVCVPGPGFDLKAKFDREEIFGFFGRRGTHTEADVFFYDDGGGSCEGKRLRDTGRAVLEFFNLDRNKGDDSGMLIT